ncbi:hypothetical protein BGCPKDLD_1870 [Methylorubrum suomiense]|uniref:Uncharacterized protein n=1 Tax=Methylorubrum suomiense TaxID=144191 RepID=A0ABQ4USH7_9HYPH|nr:hypothetical protein BGCPKDLD_1870 [Methylorubrum suomiense]
MTASIGDRPVNPLTIGKSQTCAPGRRRPRGVVFSAPPLRASPCRFRYDRPPGRRRRVGCTRARRPTHPTESFWRSWRRGLTPLPHLDVVQWAEAFRKLSKEFSNGGKFITARVEVTRGPMLWATVLRRLRAGDRADAADAILMWNRPAVLIPRRQAAARRRWRKRSTRRRAGSSASSAARTGSPRASSGHSTLSGQHRSQGARASASPDRPDRAPGPADPLPPPLPESAVIGVTAMP